MNEYTYYIVNDERFDTLAAALDEAHKASEYTGKEVHVIERTDRLLFTVPLARIK